MMPSGHKAFLVSNVKDVELLMMHNKIYAAEYVFPFAQNQLIRFREEGNQTLISTTSNVSEKRADETNTSTGSPTTSPQGSGSTSLHEQSN
jgi:hypothetical protein